MRTILGIFYPDLTLRGDSIRTMDQIFFSVRIMFASDWKVSGCYFRANADVLDWKNRARPNKFTRPGRPLPVIRVRVSILFQILFLTTVCEILLALLTNSGMVEDEMRKHPCQP